MIISHKHKFIFIKPRKVASTSVEIALSKHCGEDDVVTPISDFDTNADSDEYSIYPRNYQEKHFYNHILPEEIKQKVGVEVWNNYYKFTIVRNPWDQVVSRYFWEKNRHNTLKNQIKKTFKRPDIFKTGSHVMLFNRIIRRLHKFMLVNIKSDFDKELWLYKNKWYNHKFYFDQEGVPVCDFYIRYENLVEDYQQVCKELGIPCEKLPRTKDKFRNDRRHYSEYFNAKAKQKVKELFKDEIEYFNYKFDSEKSKQNHIKEQIKELSF